jgi:hypothetical protein
MVTHDLDPAVYDMTQTSNHFGQLCLSVASDPGHTYDFSGLDLE